MPELTDQQLITRTLEGDEAAFAALVARHERRVAATIRGVLGTIGDDELADVAQDVFLLIYRSLGSFRGDSLFSTYITRIALRHCYRESKRRRRRAATFFGFARSDDDRTAPEERIGGTARTDRRLLAEERSRAVIDALGALPEEFRTVLTLRIVEEMPVEQVAEALDVSPGTVKSRLHRAKEKMRELLSGHDLDFEQSLEP